VLLRSIQDSFDKFQGRCVNLDEITSECEKKMVEMETEYKDVVVEENPRVKPVNLYLKLETQPMGIKETIQLQMDMFSYIRRESSNSNGLKLRAWEYLLHCANFMKFLSNNRKKKHDMFFLSYMPLELSKWTQNQKPHQLSPTKGP